MTALANNLGVESKVSDYIDSTDLLDHPGELRAAFDRDGYVLIRELLDRRSVDGVRRQLLEVAGRRGWIDESDPKAARPNLAAACFEGDTSYDAAYQEMWSLEDFHRLLHAQAALQVMRQLLGKEEVLVHPRKVLRFVFPQSNASRAKIAGWHQDFPEIQGSDRTLTLWTPLAPCDPESGVLALVPGSHSSGLLPLRLSGTPIGWEADFDDVGEIHAGEMHPGDALIFSAFTVHRGTPNAVERFRLSVDCRYQPITDPISQYCLDLVGAGFGWGDVYRNWVHTDLRFYWRDQSVHSVPFDTQWEDWRDEAALEAGRRGDPVARKALELAVRFSEWLEVREEAAALLNEGAAEVSAV